MKYRLLLLRWFITTFLTAIQVVTAKIYKAKGNFTAAQKSAFNAIMVALALLLGINFLASFKELAKALRPTLRKRIHEDSELSLNLAAEVAITASNLTYTVNDGTNYKDIYTNRGNSNVPDLSCYHKNFNDSACHDQVTVQTIAHSYGETILAFDDAPYNEAADILQNKDMYRYFHRKTANQQQVAYRFNEYNPNDTQKIYPHLTNRTIYAEAQNCITYNQTGADDKDPQTLTMTDADDTGENQTIKIPKDFLGREGTTYIYRGFHAPPAADFQSCGDRCLWMWAYRNPSEKQLPVFYKCPVNISDVMNASRPEHQISNHTVKMAAAAIALHGIYHGPVFDDSRKDWTSYQFYAAGSPWDIHNHTADYVGDRLALFALGSLAAMANLSPLISVPGDVPYLGHSLQIYEPGFTIVCACIVGAHLVVFVATVLSGWRAEQETPGQELHEMHSSVEGDESRMQLVRGESGGGDIGRTGEGGSVRRGERGLSEERSIEEHGTARERGFRYV